jgi:hypothetical protein
VLTYRCEAVHLSKGKLAELDRVQGKLLKVLLGLRCSSHTTPLLQALSIDPISMSVGLNSLNLLRSCLLYNSSASHFYAYLLHCKSEVTKKTLVGRVHEYTSQNDINLLEFILCNKYRSTVLKSAKCNVNIGTDGIVDSARFLLSNNYVDHARDTLQLLVKSF